MSIETSLPYYRARLQHHEAELERALQRIEGASELHAKLEALGEANYEITQCELYRGVVRAYTHDFPMVEAGRAA